ncbi:YciI family protein [Ramlibacter ginsenosidimutans]|uniref:YciI family protein n=1 Tax=Ramlibacter ginsenosidimutans TaxID=502333 RepID=A0A934TRJ5_9BURK|nr:YciI family protein [Ramlibacter ginsenosidimutans]MBK6006069.1 YciI family protein [Ramlibacter ginsenosidimutans]
MEYLLLIHSETSGNAEAVPEAARQQMLSAYRAYTEALQGAGVMRGSNRLRPASSGTVVRMRDGKTEVQNGPFIETREELGGYYLIDVPNLDAALSWAARCPGASHGTMEVRPVWPMDSY